MVYYIIACTEPNYIYGMQMSLLNYTEKLVKEMLHKHIFG